MFSLLFILCFVSASPIPRAPWPAAGMLTRCDVEQSCVPYETKRVQYSFDFLCCEGGPDVSGYVAAHVAHPMFISFWLGSFGWAWAVAFFFEGFEITALLFFNGFIIFATTDLSLETWAGSVFGDALINGGIGALLGYLLRRAWRVPGPLEAWRFMNWKLRVKYLLLWFAMSGSFALVSITNENGGAIGTVLALLFQALWLLIVVPVLTNTQEDNDVVWVWRKQKWNTRMAFDKIPVTCLSNVCVSPVPPRRRLRLFASVFFINAALASQTSGFLSYAANDWYQVWFVCLALLAIFVPAASLRE